MSVLWTEASAVKATGGTTQGHWQALRVDIDSRRVKAGDLFVAIRGERMDGHSFVADALSKGAVAAMVDHIPDGVDAARLLVVEDTLKGLEALGKAARERSKAKVVGVTGSVGKTSAKEMLRLALSAHGSVFATSGNYNNHIGTPLNLANLPAEIDFAVFEMGMNHAGEIAHLTRMVQPHVAAITNVEAVHLEFFSGVEAIAQAKAEIFEGLVPGGVAVLNMDSPQYGILVGVAKAKQVGHILTFAQEKDADCRLRSYTVNNTGCVIEAMVSGEVLCYQLGAVGKHWASTSLLVMAVSQALALNNHKTAAALVGFSEPEGRGKAQNINGIIIIDDSYNASPISMKAAFAKAAEVWQQHGKKGRLLVALGDMLELGESSKQLHVGLSKDLQYYGISKVFAAGSLMRHLYSALPLSMQGASAGKAADLQFPLLETLRAGDVLLIKGSHGSHMYMLAKTLSEALLHSQGDNTHVL